MKAKLFKPILMVSVFIFLFTFHAVAGEVDQHVLRVGDQHGGVADVHGLGVHPQRLVGNERVLDADRFASRPFETRDKPVVDELVV